VITYRIADWFVSLSRDEKIGAGCWWFFTAYLLLGWIQG